MIGWCHAVSWTITYFSIWVWPDSCVVEDYMSFHHSFGIVRCLCSMVLLLMAQWVVGLGHIFIGCDLLEGSWLFINSSLLSSYLVEPCSFLWEWFAWVKLPVIEFDVDLMDDLTDGRAPMLVWEFWCPTKLSLWIDYCCALRRGGKVIICWEDNCTFEVF